MQGHIVPNLLHGTSEQKYWFMKGYKTGDLNQGILLTK
jgi:predicted metalloprotease